MVVLWGLREVPGGTGRLLWGFLRPAGQGTPEDEADHRPPRGACLRGAAHLPRGLMMSHDWVRLRPETFEFLKAKVDKQLI